MALDFFAGCLGGCAGLLAGHPFDTIKVRLQTQSFRNPQYKGAVDCFTSILKKESVAGLYKGMSSPMAGVALINAIVFGVYGNFQRHLPQPDALSSHFMAGATAGFVQSFVSCPMELVKTRLQVQQSGGGSGLGYSGAMDCFSQVVRAEGLRGIFRGLGTTICREVPGFGSYFLAYEFLTRSSGENGESGPPISTVHMLLAGGLSGSLSWVLTYPIDVIKTRLQVDGKAGAYRYSGFVDCLKKSIETDGYSVMTRGITSTILRAFPSNAATFTIVTWVIRWANANQVENTPAYIIAELGDLTAPEISKIQNRSNDDPKLEIKVFGLSGNLEYREKYEYMKDVFQWREKILRNFMGSNILCNEQLVPNFGQIFPSDKEDKNKISSCGSFKEDLRLQPQLTEESKMNSMNKDKGQESKRDESSEDEEATNCQQQHTDLGTEKEPNTYQHKNDYYNSSVR